MLWCCGYGVILVSLCCCVVIDGSDNLNLSLSNQAHIFTLPGWELLYIGRFAKDTPLKQAHFSSLNHNSKGRSGLGHIIVCNKI
jgi:hypothetical protein